jgi:hypothetical protein
LPLYETREEKTMDAKTQSPVTVEVGVGHDADHAPEVDPCGKRTGELSTDELDAVAGGRIFRITNIRANANGIVGGGSF